MSVFCLLRDIALPFWQTAALRSTSHVNPSPFQMRERARVSRLWRPTRGKRTFRVSRWRSRPKSVIIKLTPGLRVFFHSPLAEEMLRLRRATVWRFEAKPGAGLRCDSEKVQLTVHLAKVSTEEALSEFPKECQIEVDYSQLCIRHQTPHDVEMSHDSLPFMVLGLSKISNLESVRISVSKKSENHH